MAVLSVIDGRLSEKYNHFSEYEFVSCTATDTRLMGVIAMRLRWKSPDNDRQRYEQILHLDYSEYGIDEYFEYEFELNDSFTDEVVSSYDEIENEDLSNLLFDDGYPNSDAGESHRAWLDVSKDLGGSYVRLSPQTFIRLIDESIEVGRHNIMQREDEFADFRKSSIARYRLLREEMANRRMLDNIVPYNEAIEAVIPSKLSTFETINYFIMRLVDRDFPAAAVLSEMKIDELSTLPIVKPQVQSLIKNSIGHKEDDEPSGNVFACESITLSIDRYRLSTQTITLSGKKGEYNRKVSAVNVGYVKTLSDFEVALLLVKPEYLTVYEIPDQVLGRLEINRIEAFKDATPKMVNNGWLLTIYRKNNSHVDRSIFNISEDIIGCALVSLPGELVIMSNRLYEASTLEQSIEESCYKDDFMLKGRFMIKTSIFQTLCGQTGAMLSDLVQTEADD